MKQRLRCSTPACAGYRVFRALAAAPKTCALSAPAKGGNFEYDRTRPPDPLHRFQHRAARPDAAAGRGNLYRDSLRRRDAARHRAPRRARRARHRHRRGLRPLPWHGRVRKQPARSLRRRAAKNGGAARFRAAHRGQPGLGRFPHGARGGAHIGQRREGAGRARRRGGRDRARGGGLVPGHRRAPFDAALGRYAHPHALQRGRPRHDPLRHGALADPARRGARHPVFGLRGRDAAALAGRAAHRLGTCARGRARHRHHRFHGRRAHAAGQNRRRHYGRGPRREKRRRSQQDRHVFRRGARARARHPVLCRRPGIDARPRDPNGRRHRHRAARPRRGRLPLRQARRPGGREHREPGVRRYARRPRHRDRHRARHPARAV